MSGEEYVTLSSGARFPVIGLGTYAPLHGEDEIIVAVRAAVRAGYRHIDCAAIYRNEQAVGHALKELIVEGVVKREDLFVVSKLWNTCHRADLVLPSLKKTLEDLGLEYLDLYLIHWPMAYKEGGELCPQDENGKTLFSDVDYVDTWKALEDCQDMGLTKHIGLSNFNSKQIQRLSDSARIQPVAMQVEVNCHNSNTKLIEFCKSKNIVVIAFAPLGTPSMDHQHVKLLDEPVLKEIAAKYKKTAAQVALRFLIQSGITAVPKSVTPSRIEENIQRPVGSTGSLRQVLPGRREDPDPQQQGSANRTSGCQEGHLTRTAKVDQSDVNK
ncbi:aldo-keto reductase family 1 member B10 [Elysia marginata]|uniref:Aldo-keto reductase family 1 member B10 n=1 Tax=Elysia marginata TaxID=1093978 RepID=A0AAV4IY98_9GAST|nr:aldo-keto reductase family 1 member B10 [Elysia marginata]